MSRGDCHVMVVSDRYRAQTGYQSSSAHSSLPFWLTGSNVTLNVVLGQGLINVFNKREEKLGVAVAISAYESSLVYETSQHTRAVQQLVVSARVNS